MALRRGTAHMRFPPGGEKKDENAPKRALSYSAALTQKTALAPPGLEFPLLRCQVKALILSANFSWLKKANGSTNQRKQLARSVKGFTEEWWRPPKRNLTAFFIWLAENRARLIETVKPNKVLKAAGAEWKKLENKSVWEEKAKADKERYRKELEAFKGRSPFALRQINTNDDRTAAKNPGEINDKNNASTPYSPKMMKKQRCACSEGTHEENYEKRIRTTT
ncbi:unnamed protein product, partial [Mesorhabditis belari]|uniref:HMG box domain-containing protein n=1 Tax=Mesorhabditis belari TaxID=2138241 RepID=A0AAF3EMW1_9BILA